MPIDVLSDYPRRERSRRRDRSAIASAAAVVTGWTLVVVGFVASAMLIFLGIVILFDSVGPYLIATLMSEVRDSAPYLVVATMVAITCWTIGLRLIRGERRLVLFLRRFGFVDATAALSHALDSSLGTSWRLVTLDDATVAPLGVRKGLFRLPGAAGVLAIALIAIGAMCVASSQPVLTVGGPGSTLAVDPLLAFITFALLGAVLFVLALGFLLALVISAAVTSLRVRRSEKAKTLVISTREMINPTSGAVLRLSRGIISPRIVVVRVENAIWQAVVRRFSSVSSVVLIDISEPSESLLWEVKTLKELHSPWVLVGEQNRLRELITCDLDRSPAVHKQLLDLLNGEAVLAYTGAPADRNRFVRSLRAAFESTAASEPPSSQRA